MPVPTACPASGQDEPSVDNDGVGPGLDLLDGSIRGSKAEPPVHGLRQMDHCIVLSGASTG